MGYITYRPAAKEDCSTLSHLKKAVWNTTYRGIYPNQKIEDYDIALNTKKFEEILENPKVTLFVAMDNTTITGFMSCGEPYRPFLDYQQEIGLLYILQEYQRQGIGKALLQIGKTKSKKTDTMSFSSPLTNIIKTRLPFTWPWAEKSCIQMGTIKINPYPK